MENRSRDERRATGEGEVGRVSDIVHFPRELCRWLRRIGIAVVFHSNGKPRRLVRRALFHSNGRVRGVFRRWVYHTRGTPRSLFIRWLTIPRTNETIRPMATLFYDVSLVLRFGFEPPVGIIRVEQYLAEYLVRQRSDDVQFVVFDKNVGAYRMTLPAERDLVDAILFRRYQRFKPLSPETPPQNSTKVEATEAPRSRSGFVRKVMRELARAPRNAVRRLPRVPRGLRAAVSGLWPASSTWSRAAPSADEPLIGAFPFRRGDTLLIVSNAWDYVDYAYLTRIVRRDGVRLIAVIYDVIAMELPFTTPSPIHIYHRHWVELGHLATHLVAISRHALQSYHCFIGEPNDLDPPMSYAYLPNFLFERREEIGESAVTELLDRRFVIFCSTIETRKNHQLLLHLWDRLRQEIDCDTLPILVFVGSWGWGTECVRMLSERNWRLRDHLRILNKISDAELIWLYRNARFTVFPSLAEGFGLAAAESLSFGTPVIVSNYPALLEATEGLMPAHDPLDLPSWLAEMRLLILNDEYLSSLRTKAAAFRGADYGEFADAVLKATACDPIDNGLAEEERADA